MKSPFLPRSHRLVRAAFRFFRRTLRTLQAFFQLLDARFIVRLELLQFAAQRLDVGVFLLRGDRERPNQQNKK